jgi:hypothetical protein
MNALNYLREARRLYATDDRTDTFIAVVLLLAALSPVLLRLYKEHGE